jgi:hypothetical protein
MPLKRRASASPERAPGLAALLAQPAAAALLPCADDESCVVCGWRVPSSRREGELRAIGEVMIIANVDEDPDDLTADLAVIGCAATRAGAEGGQGRRAEGGPQAAQLGRLECR